MPTRESSRGGCHRTIQHLGPPSHLLTLAMAATHLRSRLPVVSLVTSNVMMTLIRLLLVALLVMTAGVLRMPTASADVPSISDPRYFVGANLPWYNWKCDFGCGADKGVTNPNVRAAIAGKFEQLQAANVHTVRWFMFTGDAPQIIRDDTGMPTGLNPVVYDDLDSALGLAQQYDLAIDLIILGGGPPGIPSTWVTNPAQRQQLANVLAPMFDRYRDNPNILAWELWNEPEWRIWNKQLPLPDVQETIRLLAGTVNAHTSTPTTVGSAQLDGFPWWVGLGLDFYSVHWYDYMTSAAACVQCADAPTIASANNIIGVPIVLAEFQAGGSDAFKRFRDFQAKGFAGAWAWSLFSDRTNDKMAIDMNALSQAAGGAPSPPA